MNFDINALEWTRQPADFSISDERIEITTKPHTDLWQRTYYHFRNDNAPVLQMTTDEQFFSFTVKTQFESKRRFDQCGIVMYGKKDFALCCKTVDLVFFKEYINAKNLQFPDGFQ